MNRFAMAKDARWRDIEHFEDVTAIIEAIAECGRVIRTHSLRFNPLNPVENMYRIKAETEKQAQLIEKLRSYAIGRRNGVEREMKGD